MTTSCHCLFRCNNTIEENDDMLPLSSSFLQHHHRRRRWHIVVIFFFLNTKKIKHTRKEHKKTKRREGAYLQAPTLPSLLAATFTLLFQTFFHDIFFFSNKRKEKQKQRKKNHRKENKCRERRELSFKLALCLLTFGSHFCPSVSIQTLSLGIFFFSSKK